MDGEDYSILREEQKTSKKQRRTTGKEEIESIFGYEIAIITDYQYRVNGILDLFPTSRKYHNIKTQKRGHYTSAEKIILQEVGKPIY